MFVYFVIIVDNEKIKVIIKQENDQRITSTPPPLLVSAPIFMFFLVTLKMSLISTGTDIDHSADQVLFEPRLLATVASHSD